ELTYDPCNGQHAAASVKLHRRPRVTAKSEYVSSGERGMAAEIVFDLRSEPAEVEVTVGPADHERGLAMPVFGRDLLHRRGRQKGVENADAGRIAGEELVGERVDVVVRDPHAVRQPLSLRRGSDSRSWRRRR